MNTQTLTPSGTVSAVQFAQPPADRPPNTPLVAAGVHPLRHVISGKTHLIPELKAMIQGMDVPDDYKKVIGAELDRRKSNAATVDLHVIDHANGDSSIHIHIKAVQLG